MTFDIPLIRTEDWSKGLTQIERTKIGLDATITALMLQGSLNDPKVSKEEVETFMTLSVAATIPAEA
jgi:hypothetical protein|tara:strand:- start:93 stop:293 length:201 start_codon:yes stop_codon:yes gene_type:complete